MMKWSSAPLEIYLEPEDPKNLQIGKNLAYFKLGMSQVYDI